MTLWDWSLAAWRRGGIEAAALARQDEAGESIALMLWRAWAGEAGEDVEAQAQAMAADFEAEVLRPLRTARRGLKSPRHGLETGALRDQVRSVELAAEHVLLDGLAALTPAVGGDAEVGFRRLERALGL